MEKPNLIEKKGLMEKTRQKLGEIKLVGVKVLTSNAREMNQETAQIGAIMQKFFGNGMQSQIMQRKNPGTVFAVYTNYESDHNGDYTYFLGEEVNSFENIHKDLETIIIPAQSFVKYTTEPGPMPGICINMWQKIWGMKSSDLGGERAYLADFEVYDERSIDPKNTALDIYIGIHE